MGDTVPLYKYDVPFDNPYQGKTIAYVLGDWATLQQIDPGPLVRLHSACFYGEVLDLAECECGPQLHAAWDRILEAGAGILFYLKDQEGRGAGAHPDVQAILGNGKPYDVGFAGLIVKEWNYALKRLLGLDTVDGYKSMGLPPDLRDYRHCGRFLLQHGIDEVVLLSNNLDKEDQLARPNGFGKEHIVVNRRPHLVAITAHNADYMRVKGQKMGHDLPPNLLPPTD